MLRHILRFISAIIIVAAVLTIVWGWHYNAERIFLRWPDGTIWSEVFGDLVWAVIGGLTVFFVRDRVGKRVVSWWHTLAEPHMVAQMEKATRDMHDALSGRLHDIHTLVDTLQDHLGNGYLDDLHAKIESVSDHLHARLDVIEPHLSTQDAHLTAQDTLLRELRSNASPADTK